MTLQKTLFELWPRSPTPIPARQASKDRRRNRRCTDPGTSRGAADDIVADGMLGDMMAIALRLVQQNPGCTSNELDEISGKGEGRIRKRLNDLLRRGLVRHGEPRVSRVSGKHNVTWWPVVK